MINILDDIQQYSSQLTISQVVKFFERKGLTVTKSMIQNYVRDGIMRSPVDKRYYTHKHLANLALITILKSIYEMNAVKAVLSPLIDEEGIPLEIYELCANTSNQLADKWQEHLAPVFSGAEGKELLVLMAHSVDLKDEALGRL